MIHMNYTSVGLCVGKGIGVVRGTAAEAAVNEGGGGGGGKSATGTHLVTPYLGGGGGSCG